MSRTTTPSFKALLDMAHALADRSRQAILPYFRKSIAVENKAGRGQYDPVTAADRAAERVISAHLRKHFPDHGITGEEFGDEGLGQRYRWVIDPIDGTRAFITGTPMWGTLIGLLEDDRPLLGVMDQPYTQERFWSDAQFRAFEVGERKGAPTQDAPLPTDPRRRAHEHEPGPLRERRRGRCFPSGQIRGAHDALRRRLLRLLPARRGHRRSRHRDPGSRSTTSRR